MNIGKTYFDFKTIFLKNNNDIGINWTVGKAVTRSTLDRDV